MEEISHSQHRAITALLTTNSVAEAAKESGVSKRTIFRWLEENREFKAALRSEEDKLYTEASRRLSGLLNKAITELENLLQQTMEPVDKIRTIRTIISSSLNLHEISSLDGRIEDIETLLIDLCESKEYRKGLQNAKKQNRI